MLNFDWNWSDLITGLVGVILGWLTNILRPAPGTMRKPGPGPGQPYTGP